MEESKMRFQFIRFRQYRYLSHLEVLRQMMMALTRAGIPSKYSQGFHPNIKLSFSHPLPVGLASLAEYADLALAEKLSPDQFIQRLNSVLHPCFHIRQARLIDPRTPSLMQDIDVVEYTVKIAVDLEKYPQDRPLIFKELSKDTLYNLQEKICPHLNIVYLSLFGYTKGKEGIKTLRFNDLLRKLKELSILYNFKLIHYYKKEAFAFRGDSLISPMFL